MVYYDCLEPWMSSFIPMHSRSGSSFLYLCWVLGSASSTLLIHMHIFLTVTNISSTFITLILMDMYMDVEWYFWCEYVCSLQSAYSVVYFIILFLADQRQLLLRFNFNYFFFLRVWLGIRTNNNNNNKGSNIQQRNQTQKTYDRHANV